MRQNLQPYCNNIGMRSRILASTASESIKYHLLELEIIRNPSHPGRILPGKVDPSCHVLDVGCGIGQSLTAPEFCLCAARCGIDNDKEAIEFGRRMFPELDLALGSAESIPFADNTFDLTFSRVALPYTNVRRALAEMRRVTKPGGRVWVSLHNWQLERQEIRQSLAAGNARRLIDRTYVLANSLVLAASGHCFPRPWSGRYESFQMRGPTRWLLKDLGYVEVRLDVAQNARFVVEARTPY